MNTNTYLYHRLASLHHSKCIKKKSKQVWVRIIPKLVIS